MRQCVGCQEMKSKKEMLRVIKTAEDEIILDTTGRKNGRGAYLCFSKECLLKGEKEPGTGTVPEDSDPAGGVRQSGKGVG